MKSPISFLALDQRLFDIVGGVFNIIWSFLCTIIYGLIAAIFNLFNSITQLDILRDGQIDDIYQRVTMIITIVMVFYITFEFIKYVVSPDTISDKEKGAGKIVMRIVVAILLIAFIPSIFSMGMKLQDKILSTNVIPKVIFGSDNYDYKTAGDDFAGNVFRAFYRVDSANCKTTANGCEEAQERVDKVIKNFKEGHGLIALAEANVNEMLDIDNEIQFDGLLAVAFGGFALYVVFLYCVDLAVRYVQLIFLQLIAPVAVISYIAPQKDGMLKKWTKQVTTTYLDVFIRVAILCFMILIVEKLAGAFDFYNITSNDEQINIFVYIFVIAGLLIFVQRVPKMLQELFPSNGGAASIGFGFESKTRFEPLGKSFNAIKKPIAATAGAVAGIARTGKAIKGGKLVSGKLKEGTSFRDKLKRGATYATTMARAGAKGSAAGFKNGRFSDAAMAAQRAVQSDEKKVNEGGTVLGSTFLGRRYQDVKSKLKLQIDNAEAGVKVKGQILSQADEVKAVKQAKAAWESAKNGGKSADEIERLRSEYKKMQSAVINGNIVTRTYTVDVKDENGNIKKVNKTQEVFTYVKDGKTIDVKVTDAEDKIRYNAVLQEANRLETMIKTGYISDLIATISDKGETLTVPITRVVKNPDGTEVSQVVDVPLNELSEEELRKNLGAFETAMNDAIRRVKESDMYQMAEVNASEDKK
mgnify:CR=1 FL=1